MIFITETNLLIAVLAAQFLGLLSLASIRVNDARKPSMHCQLAFFLSLALVGGATMVCLHCRHGGWLLCAITLSIMVVGATFDARTGTAHREGAAQFRPTL